MNLQKDTKWSNHRKIINCISLDTIHFHFYRLKLFALLFIFYNLQNCKTVQKQ